MGTGVERVMAPRLSMTLAVKEYGPIGGFFQRRLNGALVASPMRTPVWGGASNEYLTRATLPSGSEAEACSRISEPGAKSALGAGLTIWTVGRAVTARVNGLSAASTAMA